VTTQLTPFQGLSLRWHPKFPQPCSPGFGCQLCVRARWCTGYASAASPASLSLGCQLSVRPGGAPAVRLWPARPGSRARAKTNKLRVVQNRMILRSQNAVSFIFLSVGGGSPFSEHCFCTPGKHNLQTASSESLVLAPLRSRICRQHRAKAWFLHPWEA